MALAKAILSKSPSEVNKIVSSLIEGNHSISPLLYSNFLEVPFEKYSDQSLAIFAQGPPETDLLFGYEMDSQNELSINRVNTDYLMYSFVRKVYDLWKIYPSRKAFLNLPPVSDISEPSIIQTLLYILNKKPLGPQKVLETVVEGVWRTQGDLPEKEIISENPFLCSQLVYMYAYFEDILPKATKSLEYILKTFKRGDLQLNPGIVPVILSNHSSWAGKYQGLSLYQTTLWALRNRQPTPWVTSDYLSTLTSIEKSRLFFVAKGKEASIFLPNKLKVVWKGDHLDFLIFVASKYYENSDIPEDLEMARTFFSTAPVPLIMNIASTKKFGRLIADGIYDRNFLLDDTISYILKEKDISYAELNDWAARWSGSEEGLSKIVQRSLESHQQTPYLLLAGLRMNNISIIDKGIEQIHEYGLQGYELDDLIVSTSDKTWSYLLMKLDGTVYGNLFSRWLEKVNIHI
jgi:hypothetical protein